MKGKSSTYLNKPLIPEARFHCTPFIFQGQRKMVLFLFFPYKKGNVCWGFWYSEVLGSRLRSDLSAFPQPFPAEKGLLCDPLLQPDTSYSLLYSEWWHSDGTYFLDTGICRFGVLMGLWDTLSLWDAVLSNFPANKKVVWFYGLGFWLVVFFFPVVVLNFLTSPVSSVHWMQHQPGATRTCSCAGQSRWCFHLKQLCRDLRSDCCSNHFICSSPALINISVN